MGVLTVMDTPTSSQRPYVFIEGSDGNLWLRFFDGANWQWDSQGTPPGVGLGGVVRVLTVMDTNKAPQRPYVFVKGTDGNLWLNWRS